MVQRTSKRQPGRPKDDGTDRRKIILEAAMEEFGYRGYEGCSLAHIAEKADITKAALLHHFQSKERLFAEVLKLRDIKSLTSIAHVMRYSDINAEELFATGDLPMESFSNNPWDVVELLEAVVKLNETEIEQVRLFIMVAGHAASGYGPANEYFKGHVQFAVKMIAEGLEAAKDMGAVVRDAPSYQIARTVVAIMDGIQLQWVIAHDHDGHEEWCATSLVDELHAYMKMVKDKYGVKDA